MGRVSSDELRNGQKLSHNHTPTDSEFVLMSTSIVTWLGKQFRLLANYFCIAALSCESCINPKVPIDKCWVIFTDVSSMRLRRIKFEVI